MTQSDQSPPITPVTRIAIIGTGLIGGSIGLALRSVYPDLEIVGFDENESLSLALDRGAVTLGAVSPARAVENCQIVIVATPISSIPGVFNSIAGSLLTGAVVTDVGSVKAVVEQFAREILPDSVHFVGGHPMAGSEKGGIAHADRYLLENASYVLCPPTGFDGHPMVYGELIRLLEGVGARIILMDADRHDRIATAVSHIPQLMAVALTNLVAGRNASDDTTLKLAAGGFRDMTRIASSPFGLWRDVLQSNHASILDGLADLVSEIQKLRHRLIEEDLDAIEKSFESARDTRESIPRNTKGFLRPLSDVYVNASDRPGALLAIVQHLYDAGLSIKDIELLKLREGTGGTFRLGFETRRESAKAIDVLTADGHQARQL